MAYLDDLTTIRNNLVAALKAASVNPQPSYSVEGQTFSWVEYYRFLSDAIEKQNDLIVQADPFIEVTRHYL